MPQEMRKKIKGSAAVKRDIGKVKDKLKKEIVGQNSPIKSNPLDKFKDKPKEEKKDEILVGIGDGELVECINCHSQKKSIYFCKDFKGKYIPICKDCLKRVGINENGYFDYEKAIKVLEAINKPFINEIFSKALKSNVMEKSKLTEYLKMINNVKYKDATFFDSEEPQKEANDTINKSTKIYSNEWCGNFTQQEIDFLDKNLEDLKRDFKIATSNHLITAKRVCLAALDMNIADSERRNCLTDKDIENYDFWNKRFDEASKMFKEYSKAGKFSESDRKENEVALGCFGLVFDEVEKNSWIPKYQVNENDKDIYDKLLDQYSNILKSYNGK